VGLDEKQSFQKKDRYTRQTVWSHVERCCP
jgi:hypothetical protein